MTFLVFRLQGPLASWGDTAVGEYRPSVDYPGESALIGLLGAALGIRREEEDAHAALRQGYGFAIGLQSTGSLLRDYHTAQVPGQAALKNRPHSTRRDELSVPKEQLNTVLSTRDYRQDAACLVAIQAREQPPYALAALAEALRRPRFVLYLGRKSCPPAAPMHPMLIDEIDAHAAFEAYRATVRQARESCADSSGRLPLNDEPEIMRLIWSDCVSAGMDAHLTTRRKDRLIRRQGWQMGDRNEHVALLREED